MCDFGFNANAEMGLERGTVKHGRMPISQRLELNHYMEISLVLQSDMWTLFQFEFKLPSTCVNPFATRRRISKRSTAFLGVKLLKTKTRSNCQYKVDPVSEILCKKRKRITSLGKNLTFVHIRG